MRPNFVLPADTKELKWKTHIFYPIRLFGRFDRHTLFSVYQFYDIHQRILLSVIICKYLDKAPLQN